MYFGKRSVKGSEKKLSEILYFVLKKTSISSETCKTSFNRKVTQNNNHIGVALNQQDNV